MAAACRALDVSTTQHTVAAAETSLLNGAVSPGAAGKRAKDSISCKLLAAKVQNT
jgi:hypothetical protein